MRPAGPLRGLAGGRRIAYCNRRTGHGAADSRPCGRAGPAGDETLRTLAIPRPRPPPGFSAAGPSTVPQSVPGLGIGQHLRPRCTGGERTRHERRPPCSYDLPAQHPPRRPRPARRGAGPRSRSFRSHPRHGPDAAIRHRTPPRRGAEQPMGSRAARRRQRPYGFTSHLVRLDGARSEPARRTTRPAGCRPERYPGRRCPPALATAGHGSLRASSEAQPRLREAQRVAPAGHASPLCASDASDGS